ncbi:MAG: hypothetical protein ACRENS_00915 [Candidatus Eiseniibacteriota bacterium]
MLLVAAFARDARAQACVPEECQPSPSSSYASAYHNSFSSSSITVDLSDLVLHSFSTCGPPPASSAGSTATQSFNAVMDFKLSVNGGSVTSGQAPAVATIRLAFNHEAAPTRFFDTEMLQLDISGGALPSGTLVRESPTLASTGQTTIQDLGGGNFHVESFFDVFFELSLDGGVTWMPASNGPDHMTLSGPGCPTPNHRRSWGQLKLIYR